MKPIKIVSIIGFFLTFGVTALAASVTPVDPPTAMNCWYQGDDDLEAFINANFEPADRESQAAKKAALDNSAKNCYDLNGVITVKRGTRVNSTGTCQVSNNTIGHNLTKLATGCMASGKGPKADKKLQQCNFAAKAIQARNVELIRRSNDPDMVASYVSIFGCK